ncbi:hypothetical protein ACHAP7_012160 [Fusarium lateritium]
MICVTVLFCFLFIAQTYAHPKSFVRQKGKSTYVSEVYIPDNRKDDQFYNIDINFNGQTLPIFLDTGSADIMVAADTCNVVNVASGCYLSKTYKLGKTTKLGSEFGTVVGVGGVSGNISALPVTIGGLRVDKLSTPLINYADTNEFQEGSFSGILGLAPRNVSRNYYFNHKLPPIDDMITRGLLDLPKFSLSLPRFGDLSSRKGKLTLGGIEALPPGASVTYNEIINSPNYNYDNKPFAPQSWTAELQAIRMNGKLIKVKRGSIDPKGRYMSLMDSGAQTILFRYDEFTAVANAFKGKKIIQDGHAVYFDCSVPQLLELKYHDRWFPVDPLDLIIPNDHGVTKGTDMCHAAIETWDRAFADSIIGVPFLRNVISVFDYVTPDLYKVQPRLGLASVTNGANAMKRYPLAYKSRIGDSK